MAFEQNYRPDPSGNVPPSGCSFNRVVVTDGAPTCAGFEGDAAIDRETGDVYKYESGAWTLSASGGGGGGGGTGATYSGSGSPQGVQSGSPGNTYWDATNNVFYVKDTGTGTTTGWLELVAI